MASPAVLLREQIQSTLRSRCGAAFSTGQKPSERGLQSAIGNIPRGALTEVAGPASSGRTSLLYSILATACAEQEFCAFLDTEDSFDPESAAAAGVQLSQILWVRCGGNVEHALKAADMLAQAGGFGVVAIDLGNTPVKATRRIPLAAWFRLRHAVENTRTALIVVSQQMQARSCSALKIDLSPSRPLWRGRLPGCLLRGFEAVAQSIRNHKVQEHKFIIAR